MFFNYYKQGKGINMNNSYNKNQEEMPLSGSFGSNNKYFNNMNMGNSNNNNNNFNNNNKLW